MNRTVHILFVLLLLFWHTTSVYAAERSPWGTASVLDTDYEPGKVLYDLTTGDAEYLGNILDRLAYLYRLYEADPMDSSIIVVIHGEAIPFFAIDKLKGYRKMMAEAQSLTVGTTIEFRMCRTAAKILGYEPEDIHGYIKTVPMADAEIVRLQQEEGYAYMR